MQRAIKWAVGILCSIAFLCGGFVILHGSLPPASINAWLPAGDLTAARSRAASVLLQDGRLLITGGNSASGELATTEVLDPANGFTAGPPMNLARSNHVAVLLQDGRVLVAGGTDASGRASQSAELFDPALNTWSASGPLMVGRSGETATLLPSGQVLIAGGTANGAALASLELFDPNSNTFSLVAGALSSPRENHAAALLPDGRVLIAGGWDGTTLAPVPPATTGGPNVLASTDIFDPSTGAVAPGPALTSPRMNFSATTALDGSVIAIGGSDGQNDLASIDVLAPGAGAFALSGAKLATARQGHQAFLLPHNGNILVVGGTSSGASISSAELYTPWTGATSVAGAMASARSGATGSPLFQTVLGAPAGIDGALLVAGGLDASSPPSTLQSAELYGFATIKTDKPDYAPGDTVNISGSGWQAGETVQMSVVEVPDLDGDSPIPLTAVADANGNFSNVTLPINVADLNIHFTLTAVGAVSQAQTTFTDSSPDNTSMTVSCSPNPVSVNNPTTCTAQVNDVQSGAPNGHPQGTVKFSLTIGSGTFSPSDTCTLTQILSSKNSSCSVTLTPSASGNATVKGQYNANPNSWNNNNATTPLTVNGTVSITFTQSGIGNDSTGTVVSISGTSGGVAVGPFNETAANLPFAHSFDNGTTVTYSYSSPVSTGSSTKQYRWNTTSGLSQTLQTNTFTVSAAGTVTGNYVAQYKVTFDASSNVKGDSTATIVTVGGNAKTSANLPYTTDFLDSGSSLTYSYASPVASSSASTTTRYRWDSTSGLSQTLQSNTFNVAAAGTVTATYVAQYKVTFDASSNVKGDSSATIVTEGGNAKTSANLPYTTYFPTRRSSHLYSYASPVASSSASTTTRYRWDSTSGLSQTLQSNTLNVTAAGTVTATYVTQYQVTFDASSNVKGDSTATIVTVDAAAKAAGSLPFSKFVDSGTSVMYSYSSPVASSGAPTTTRYRWDSTSGLSQTLQSNTFNVTAAGTVTATYVAQYKVTFDASSNVKGDSTATIVTVGANAETAASLPYMTDFLDSGSSLTYSYASPVASSGAPTTPRYWSESTRGLSQTLQSNTFNVTAAGTVTATYVTQYQVTFDASSNVKGDSTATIVTVDAAAKAAGSLPFSKFVDSGTSVMYSYSSPVASSGAPTTTRYRWDSTSGLSQTLQSNTFNVTAAGTVTATYVAQYKVTFDASSNVKGDSTATIVTVGANAETAASLPYMTDFLDSGSSLTYSYASPVASSGAPTTTRYRWDSTSGLSQTLQSNTFNVTAAGTVTATYAIP